MDAVCHNEIFILYLLRKAVNMLKYLAKTSKTPAEEVIVVRDGEEVLYVAVRKMTAEKSAKPR